MRHRQDWPDIDYTVFAEAELDDLPRHLNPEPAKVYRARFTVYQHMGRFEDGRLLFMKEDEMGAIVPADSIEDADVWMQGTIRWDGESTWACENLQFYSRAALTDFVELLARCWDWAGELMPETWSPYKRIEG